MNVNNNRNRLDRTRDYSHRRKSPLQDIANQCSAWISKQSRSNRSGVSRNGNQICKLQMPRHEKKRKKKKKNNYVKCKNVKESQQNVQQACANKYTTLYVQKVFYTAIETNCNVIEYVQIMIPCLLARYSVSTRTLRSVRAIVYPNRTSIG